MAAGDHARGLAWRCADADRDCRRNGQAGKRSGGALGPRRTHHRHRLARRRRRRARTRRSSRRQGCAVEGGDNAWAAREGEVVVLTVPYEAHGETLRAIAEAAAGKVLVDMTVPLKPPKVSRVQLPAGQAAALEAQALVGPSTPVVAAASPRERDARRRSGARHRMRRPRRGRRRAAPRPWSSAWCATSALRAPRRGAARQRHRPRVAHARLDSSESHLQEPGGGDRVHGSPGRRTPLAYIHIPSRFCHVWQISRKMSSRLFVIAHSG